MLEVGTMVWPMEWWEIKWDDYRICRPQKTALLFKGICDLL